MVLLLSLWLQTVRLLEGTSSWWVLLISRAVKDEGLRNLMLSWYYAGYYSGLYEGQRQSVDKAALESGRDVNGGSWACLDRIRYFWVHGSSVALDELENEQVRPWLDQPSEELIKYMDPGRWTGRELATSIYVRRRSGTWLSKPRWKKPVAWSYGHRGRVRYHAVWCTNDEFSVCGFDS